MAENEVKIHITTQDDSGPGREKSRGDFQKLGDDVAGDLDKKLSDGGTKAGKDMGSNASKSAAQASQGGGGMMATMIAGGLVAGGPAIGAAMAGIGALGLVALGAKLQAGAPQIQAAWATLANDAKTQATAYSAGMVTPISDALSRIDADLIKQGPLIQQIFSGAAADIPVFTDGLLSLADNALPGFTNAIQNSKAIVQGLASIMGDVGTGISDIGNQVASNSGRIGGDLNQLGSAVHTVESTLGSLVSISSGLAQGALPVLNGALTVTSSVVAGLGSALGPLEPLIGGIALAGVAGWKLLPPVWDAASKGATSLAGGILNMGAGIESTSPKLANMAMNTAGLVESLGPAGLFGAAGVALLVMDKLGQNAQETARNEQQLQGAVQVTAQVLQQANGIVNDSTTAAEAAALQNQDWVRTLTQSGASLKDVTDAALGVPGALDKVTASTKSQLDASNPDKAIALGKAITDLANSAPMATKANQDLADAQGKTGQSASNAAPQVTTLSDSIAALDTAASTTSTEIRNIQTAAKQLADHGVEPASDAISSFYNDLDNLTASLKTAGAAHATFKGQIDLTTKAGRDVQKAVEGARDDFISYATNARNAGASTADVTAKIQQMSGDLLNRLLPAFHGNKQAAQDFINTILGTPQSIVTTVNLNTNQAYSALEVLLNRINNSSANITIGATPGGAAVLHGGQQIPKVSGGPTGLSHYDTGGATGDLTMNEHGGEAVRLPTGSMVIPNSSADGAARTAFERSSGGASGSMEMKFTGTQTAFSTLVMNEFRAGRIQLVANGQRVTVG